MSFCLDDGAELLYGPARSEPGAVATGCDDEPQTAILHETAPPSEAATRAQIHTTAAEPQSQVGEASERQSLSAHRAAEPRKGFDKRLLLAPLALAVIVLGGFFGYRYFNAAGTEQINSIAVMPFVNESGNAEVEYLSDGMTETLIKSLSQLPNLNVKARSSVFRYKGKVTDSKTIGTELGVQTLLNGRIVQRGDQLAVSLELIDARTENVLWTEQYDRRQTDLINLQSAIAKDVSAKLRSKLSGAEEAQVAKTYTANPEAYQLYLKGRFVWNKRTGESLKQAVEFYKQAIEKDPNYALAYSGLAETYVLFSSYYVARAQDSMPQAKAAAQRALELDDSLAEAHTALGEYLNHYEFDRVGAEREFRRAIELNSNYATAHQWLGNVLGIVKRFDEALIESRRAEELDPLSPIISMNLADNLVFARRYDEGIAQYKRTLSLNPDFSLVHWGLATPYAAKGALPEAVAATRKYLETGHDPVAKGYLGQYLAKSGRRDEALKLVDELEQKSTQQYVPSISFALIYIGLGDNDKAFTWLEKEVSERGAAARWLAVLPELDDVRFDPRFKAMLKRLNLPE